LRSLEEWLAHQERVHPKSIDMGLERLARVLDRLDWRQPPAPVITIAGTNGKGSVAAFSTGILAAAGYRVGTFTSPHLRDYRERIRLDGRLVSAAELCSAFERIEDARIGSGDADCADGVISLTFFEYNALAAMLIFESASLDAWVLEVGMGGRLDAVNAVDPSVAAVVSIGLDHQEFLGTTIEAIAREKAGIFRAGIPAVFGSYDITPALEARANAVGARLKRLGREYDFVRSGAGWRFRGTRWELPDLPAPGLLGDAQYRNAATAIAALEELDGRLRVPPASIARGVASTRLTARFQVIETAGPTWILDVAHNPDAAEVLAQNLRSAPCAGRTLAVCGILADKDAAGVASRLAGCIDEWWLPSTEGARGTSGAALAARIGSKLHAPANIVHDVASACSAALSEAQAADRIVVFGSFHTVGPAMDWLEARALLPSGLLREYTEPPRSP
jgi:dihydrofolate synthase/folylpolyglutamate synthase